MAGLSWDPGPPPTGAAGAFDEPAYLEASAHHTGAEPVVATAAGAHVALLREPAATVRTVYGYPHAWGAEDGLDALADGLAALPSAWLALAPFGPGAALAGRLAARRPPASTRPILVHELDPGADPLARFERRARRAARTAGARGASVRTGSLEPWFGGLYRAAMTELDATALYHFADAYFATLAALDHAVVIVEDEHGVAAAMLWLFDADAGWYHLGGRRPDPPPVVGAMNLATLEGLRETARRGRGLAVLGGGRGTGTDDALYAFKAQMATRALPRPVFALGGPGGSS